MKNTAEQFWKMLEPFHPEAEGFCRKLAGSREDGDDLYQDSLLIALRKHATLRDPESFRPWIYRIIVNRHKNRCRQPWWRLAVPLDRVESSVGDDPSKAHAWKRLLDRALGALSPEDKALIILFEVEGWSIAELAELHDKPEGTIKARLSRARKKMRKALEKYLPESNAADKTGERQYALQRSDTPSE
ncbi:MAG: RNA polymerase sigma factor [Candidatus Zixiibacteriota bacterium]